MDGNQNSSSTNDEQRFVEHLEQATEIVRSWPLWKQAVLGGLEVRQPVCDQNHLNGETGADKQ